MTKPVSSNDMVFVIGSGPAGYGAAKQLVESGIDTKIIEKNSYFGGHCASFEFKEGFVFDDGPHISFTKIDEVKKQFAKNADFDVSEFSAYVDNYWHGHWIKHPAITSLYGIPEDIKATILKEVKHAIDNKDDGTSIANYEEWLIKSYGETYARQFPMEYTIKYHSTEAKNLTTDWLGPRLYLPDYDEVVQGMLATETPDKHYISEFRYPNKKGFSNFLSEVNDIAPISFQSEVTEIDVMKRTFTINGTETHKYGHLISSMPLPMIVDRIKAAPVELLRAAEKLACTKAIIVNLGIRKPNVSKAHWSYFYDADICFARLSFPHKFSSHTVPDGCSAIQAEIYFSDKYRPLNISIEQGVENTIRDLLRVGLIDSADDVIFSKAWVTPYAQIIFDHDRKQAVEVIHNFLKENNIEYCGRFGDWAYIWSDESYLSGKAAASRILAKR